VSLHHRFQTCLFRNSQFTHHHETGQVREGNPGLVPVTQPELPRLLKPPAAYLFDIEHIEPRRFQKKPLIDIAR
jgi:hypothetical protein